MATIVIATKRSRKKIGEVLKEFFHTVRIEYQWYSTTHKRVSTGINGNPLPLTKRTTTGVYKTQNGTTVHAADIREIHEYE